MVRLVTSLNWVIGTLLVLSALLYPMIDAKVGVGGDKQAVELQVATLVSAQQTHYRPIHSKFALFDRHNMHKGLKELNMDGGDLEQVGHKFLYETVDDGAGGAVVRAIAKSDLVRKGEISPLIYEYSLPKEGGGEGRWLPLSGKSAGLW